MRADPQVFHLRSSAGLYGAERMLLGLLPALANDGIPSTLLCLDNQHLREQTLYGKALALNVPAQRVPCRGRFDPATVEALRTLLASSENSVLHVHDYKSALYAWLARGRRAVPIVATFHGQYSTTARLHLYHRLELRLMRRFDRVCAVSAEMRPLLVRAGVPRRNICLIENGIDTDRFTPDVEPLRRADFGIAQDAIVFGAAMRLTAQKNPLGLVDAFAKVARSNPRAMLVIAGDGPLSEELLTRVGTLGLAERVRLLGVRDDLERFYTMIDVFVLPSVYEGLPLALLEAMAAACPVVATRVGQVPRALDGLPCAMVAAGDSSALAQSMCNAIPPRAEAALRRRALERYSLACMAHGYAQVYRDIRSCRERAVA